MIRFAICFWLLLSGAAFADSMRLAVTTSFHNSGLSDVLLPAINEDIDIEVQLLVVGTGQALRLGRAGDVDAIFVHSKAAEEAFVLEGFAPYRREIMYNDFVLVGPVDDPVALPQAVSASDSLARIAEVKAPFVSRGDESGTHKKELALWDAAALDVGAFDRWYKAVGAGMGASLNTASATSAYILADRASWLNFGNKADLALFNQYAYLPVSATKHAHVNVAAAQALEAWLVSRKAADLINGYTINGVRLFTFNATD